MSDNQKEETSRAKKTAHELHSADPIVPEKVVSARPGSLHGEATIEIHTRQAQKLVYGRRHDKEKKINGIIGLYRYGLKVSRVYTAATLDDPWADLTLIRLEERLKQAREKLNDFRNLVRDTMNHGQISIKTPHSDEPIIAELKFATPYAFMGAYLLADYDELVRDLLALRRVAPHLISTARSEKMMSNAGSLIRGVFAVPSLHESRAITRDDVKQGIARAVETNERMSRHLGELPEEVLSGELRPEFGPDIKNKSKSSKRGRRQRLVAQAAESDNSENTESIAEPTQAATGS